MLFRRLKTPGLAQHSYLLECGDGRALVVDPRRDIDEYLRLAGADDLTITHVLETQRQEDRATLSLSWRSVRTRG